MDPRPRYSHADANILKRAIRRSAGWKPMSMFYARTLNLRIPVIELSAPSAAPGAGG